MSFVESFAASRRATRTPRQPKTVKADRSGCPRPPMREEDDLTQSASNWLCLIKHVGCGRHPEIGIERPLSTISTQKVIWASIVATLNRNERAFIGGFRWLVVGLGDAVTHQDCRISVREPSSFMCSEWIYAPAFGVHRPPHLSIQTTEPSAPYRCRDRVVSTSEQKASPWKPPSQSTAQDISARRCAGLDERNSQSRSRVKRGPSSRRSPKRRELRRQRPYQRATRGEPAAAKESHWQPAPCQSLAHRQRQSRPSVAEHVKNRQRHLPDRDDCERGKLIPTPKPSGGRPALPGYRQSAVLRSACH
jgi:hypothetical protein